MNPKIFVIAAVAVLAVALGAVLFASSTMFAAPADLQDQRPAQASLEPLIVELDDVSVLDIDQRSATIQVKFFVSNPNPVSVLVQVMDYQLYETGFSADMQVSGGQIGSRPAGMVEFGNNYYTLLAENTLVLKDKIVLKNTGNANLWSSLEDGTAKWKVTGDLFYNLSSMTSGQENEIHFEFEQ